MTVRIPPRIALALALVGLVLAGSDPIPGQAEEEPAERPATTVDDLAWLAGSWRAEDGFFEEHWLPPHGGTMAAVSRMTRDGETVLYELSSIEPGDDGVLRLHVRHFDPGLAVWASEADGPQSWTLARHGEREAVFEDPARTFPRRIVYRRVGEDALEARLEGEQDGQPRTVVFPLQR